MSELLEYWSRKMQHMRKKACEMAGKEMWQANDEKTGRWSLYGKKKKKERMKDDFNES